MKNEVRGEGVWVGLGLEIGGEAPVLWTPKIWEDPGGLHEHVAEILGLVVGQLVDGRRHQLFSGEGRAKRVHASGIQCFRHLGLRRRGGLGMARGRGCARAAVIVRLFGSFDGLCVRPSCAHVRCVAPPNHPDRFRWRTQFACSHLAEVGEGVLGVGAGRAEQLEKVFGGLSDKKHQGDPHRQQRSTR